MSTDSPRAVFLHCLELEGFDYPAHIPFNTQRARKTRELLCSMGLLADRDWREQRIAPACREDLERFHTARYLNALQRAGMGEAGEEAFSMGLGTCDCPIFPAMYDYSDLACGATLKGARHILAGEADVAFNPSGGHHHAGPDHAAGFCYINDVAIGCMVLAEAGNRVLYLDVDVHHGDGVQNAFYDRSDVMTISLHQDGRTLFPGTGFEGDIGVGAGAGYSVNIPLPPGTCDEAYLHAFDTVAMPLMKAYNPDVFVVELGMDALAGDPLGGLQLTNNAFACVIARVRQFGRPILAMGGGGYHVPNTVRGWALAWACLIGEDMGDDLTAGLGGGMLQNADWKGGLRDRVLPIPQSQRQTVRRIVEATIEEVRGKVFPIHGLK